MILTDSIADLLTRIRNGYLVRKKTVAVPLSKSKEEVIKILVKSGYLDSYKRKDKELVIVLKYDSGHSKVSGIKRVSKPGVRIYRRTHEIPRTQSGYGVTIISTSKGLMTDKEARKQNIGGEIICQVW